MTYEAMSANGIRITSNYPLDQVPPSGSVYVIDVHWKQPISGIADVASIMTADSLMFAMRQNGYTGEMLSFAVSQPDPLTTRVQATFTSPPVLMAILAVIGVLGGAGIAYYINQTTTTVVQGLGSSLVLLGYAAGAAILAGTAVYAYSFLTSKGVRRESARYVGAGLRGGRKTYRAVRGAYETARKFTHQDEEEP